MYMFVFDFEDEKKNALFTPILYKFLFALENFLW